jgi:hypothetical protein|tara:strand:+ start:153 stop:440 length:288 start_codon:yes stop_codon:yes gene_type:complete
MRKQHDYQSKVHEVIEASCHVGQELHIITSNAYGDRVLNLRMNRVMPSQTGHTGYTKIGMFLNRAEARKLRDALIDLIEDDSAWDPDGGEWDEVE